MRYRQLGFSDLEVSEIALGSWLTFGVGVERDRALACVRRAFDVGINFIDTANVYGRGAAESFLGEALGGDGPAVVHTRDETLLPDVGRRSGIVRRADP